MEKLRPRGAVFRRLQIAGCTPDLAAKLVACDYLHQPRIDRLSDYSALSVCLAVAAGEKLITSDLAAVSEPPTLF
jgi:hypothetical protein